MVGLGDNGKCKEKSASCAEVINLIINRLQAVKIGRLTKVHIVGHKNICKIYNVKVQKLADISK